MIILGEFFHKAINEGFQVELEVDGQYAGLVLKQDDDVYMCVKNGRISAVERVYKRAMTFANNIVIKENKVIVRG